MFEKVLKVISDCIRRLIYRRRNGKKDISDTPSSADFSEETSSFPPRVDVKPVEPPEAFREPITQNLGDTTAQGKFDTIESVDRSTLPTVVDNVSDPNPQVEPEISYSADAKSGEGKHKSASESRDATDSHDGSVEAPVNQPYPLALRTAASTTKFLPKNRPLRTVTVRRNRLRIRRETHARNQIHLRHSPLKGSHVTMSMTMIHCRQT